MPYEELLRDFCAKSRAVFGENLVGVYLHGSAAMGCFNPKKSDLDLLLVVERPPTREEKLAFLGVTLRANAQAPAKGLELSVVRRAVCSPFVYPTPYEFHFSNGHRAWAEKDPQDYVDNMQGTDKDLAAHCTVINHYGIALYGPPVQEVFGPVPPAAYLDSLWYDVQNAQQDILEDPVYVTLNLCRVLAFLQDGAVLSKKSGGEWGLRELPGEYGPLIVSALESYGGEGEMESDPAERVRFAREMLARIQRGKIALCGPDS